MSPLDQLVDQQFRPCATRAFGLAIEKAAEQFVNETLGSDHFKRLLEASIDRTAKSMATELISPFDAALGRAVGVAFEQGLRPQEISARLRAYADQLTAATGKKETP
jgi:hypothetical protein